LNLTLKGHHGGGGDDDDDDDDQCKVAVRDKFSSRFSRPSSTVLTMFRFLFSLICEGIAE
jgi:hypothetical protein